MSIVLFICYSAHIFLVISKEEQKQLSVPQKGLTIVLGLQILFNDPLHLLYAYKATTTTYLVSEVLMASFLCGLLCFWITELGSEHPTDPTESDKKEPHCRSLFSSQVSSVNRGSLVCMVFLYLSMLGVFTLLYVTYLFKVQKHPDF
jgi:hypothetical protein